MKRWHWVAVAALILVLLNCWLLVEQRRGAMAVGLLQTTQAPLGSVLQVQSDNAGAFDVIVAPASGTSAVVSNLADGLAPIITGPNAALVSNPGGTAALWKTLNTDNVLNASGLQGTTASQAIQRVQSSVGVDSFVYNVGKASNFFGTIQAAIDAINVQIGLGNIGSGQRATIKIWPGQYVMTARLDVPGFVSVEGVSDKSTVQLFNDTSDMFRSTGDNTWYSGFIVEGSANPAVYAFDANNTSGFHLRNLDMLNHGGTSQQKFLKQSGATWHTMFLEHLVLDSYQLDNYLVFLENTSVTGRFCDVEINDVFADTYHLTNFGGGFLVRGCQDVRFRDSKIRGIANFQTGVRIEKGTPTGAPTVEVFATYFDGQGTGVSIYNQAGTTVSIYNCQAPNSIFDGGNVIKNSFVT
jgi:hypothetical protein